MVIYVENRKFSHPRIFCVPNKGVPFGIGIWRRDQEKTVMMGLPDGQKSFKMGLAV